MQALNCEDIIAQLGISGDKYMEWLTISSDKQKQNMKGLTERHPNFPNHGESPMDSNASAAVQTLK